MHPALKRLNWRLCLAAAVGILLLVLGGRAGMDYLDARALNKIHTEIARLCLAKYSEDGKSVPDALRSCVHYNTTHNIDDEFFAHWKDQRQMAQAMLDHLNGTTDHKPHYECSTRTGLMLNLLKVEGLKAQDLIVARFEKEYSDHVVVGVWDEQKKSWVVHDPSYDIFFVNAATKEPVTAHDLLQRPLKDFVPCTEKDKCSWDIVTDQKIPVTELFGLWGIMAYKDFSGKWDLLYNKKKFDPYQVLGEQSYCEKRRKYCKTPPVEIGTLK